MTIKTMIKDKFLQLSAADYTDRGTRRPLNEDTVFHQTNHLSDGRTAGLYLICDGMGGLNAGNVASQLASNKIVAEMAGLFYPNQWVAADNERTQPAFCTLTHQLKKAVEEANRELFIYSQQKSEFAGKMGTTVTAALVYGNWLHIAHVGDSRAYLWRDGTLKQLTRDHSMAVQLLEAGLLDPAKSFKHPTRNRLLKAVGVEKQVTVDVCTQELRTGDKILLCSDGLWQAFPDETKLQQWLDSPTEPAELVRQLGAEARERDGSDNISAVLITVDEMYSWDLPLVKAVAHFIREDLALAR